MRLYGAGTSVTVQVPQRRGATGHDDVHMRNGKLLPLAQHATAPG